PSDGGSSAEPDLLTRAPNHRAQLGRSEDGPHLVSGPGSCREAARDRALLSRAITDRAQQLRGGARSGTGGDADLQVGANYSGGTNDRDLSDPQGVRRQQISCRRLGHLPLRRAGRGPDALLSAGGRTRQGIDLAPVAGAQRWAEGLGEHDGHGQRYGRDRALDPRLGRRRRGPGAPRLAQEDFRRRREEGRAPPEFSLSRSWGRVEAAGA